MTRNHTGLPICHYCHYCHYTTVNHVTFGYYSNIHDVISTAEIVTPYLVVSYDYLIIGIVCYQLKSGKEY
jgi:hypothetical protein